MEDSLYEQYSEGIYYERTLAEAEPHDVRALFVSYNQTPVSIAPYTELRYLSFSVPLVDPPWEEIALLTKLEHFSCEKYKHIGKLSLLDVLSQSPGLLELNLDEVDQYRLDTDNSEGALPKGVLGDSGVFRHWPRLRWLRIRETLMAAFADAICDCGDLDTLVLESVGLINVPQAIGQLQQLKTLSLARNTLSEVPPGLAALTQLQHLDLSGNPISEVPRFMAQLTQLRTLSLAGCGLTTLPGWLADLPKLKVLDLKGNAFEELPTALKKLGSKVKLEPRMKALYDDAVRQKLKEDGLTPAAFTDFGFKLMVIEELMYRKKLLSPAFDVHTFAKEYVGRTIDPEGIEAYEVIPEVKAYFEQLPIPLILLEEIDSLNVDAGDEIYGHISPLWDGEDDRFNVQSAKDAKLLPHLKTVSAVFLTDKAQRDLRKLGIEVD